MLLSGDPLEQVSGESRKTLTTLIKRSQKTSAPVVFDDIGLNYGNVPLGNGEILHGAFTYLENGWVPVSVEMKSDVECDWFDFWSGQKLNTFPTKIYELNLSENKMSALIISK